MTKPPYIPPSLRGVAHVFMYCNKCKSTIIDTCKLSGLPLKKCEHKKDQRFKYIRYLEGGKNTRHTKILNAKDIYEAIEQAIKIDKEIEDGTYFIGKAKSSERKKEIPVLLTHCFAKYVSYLHGEDVPLQFRKTRTLAHIKDVEHAFIVFIEALKEKLTDWEMITIDDLNDEVIGYIYEYLEQRNYSPRTKNKYYSYGKSFLKWWQDEYYPIRNWFSRITRHEEVHNPQSISLEEFNHLLKIISPEGGIKDYQSKSKPTRNYYKSYLKSAFQLGLLTGLRREELINLKWGNIQHDETGQPSYIKVEDYKSNRITKKEVNKKYKFVPISSELSELLNEFRELNEYKNDDFILAPEIQKSRTKSMADSLSRGFSHYYSQLNTGKELTFKSLRKSYITALKQYTFNPKEISGHSDNHVIERHYIDREQVALSMKDFQLFPGQEQSRDTQLNKLRKDSKQNQKSREK